MTALEGPFWRLDSLATGDAGLVPLPEGVEAGLQFADGTVSGSGGLNRFFGPYSLEGEVLSLGPLATTLMAGVGPGADAEPVFLAALAATTSGEAADGTLVLRGAGGEVLAVLVAEQPTP